MKKDMIIITSAGFVIGLAEALIYYNMGRKKKEGKFSYSIPPAKELAQTMTIVIITSLATALVTKGIEKGMGPSKKLALA